MFVVSPFEVVYKIKETTVVAHDVCMAAACRLLWATAVGLSAVAHGGYRAPRRLVVKSYKFQKVCIILQIE
jgi:hypothetical protein